MKSNLFNLLSLLVVLTLLLTTSGTPVTAQARLPKPNAAPESPSDKAGSVPAVTIPPETLPSTLATQARVRQSFGQLPLYFVENQGQLDERVAYYIQGSDKTLYFTPDGVTFALTAPITPTQRAATDDRPTRSLRPLGNDETSPLLAGGTEGGYQRWAVKLDFVDANPNVRPMGQEKTETIISYFKGPQDQWHAGLPTYSRIIYPDLWPGIDLVYYGTVNQLKYEFIVHPGADPNQIRLAYRGATDVTLNAAGQMQVTTPLGGFTDDTPVAYQEMNGQRVTVPMAYQTSEVSALHTPPSTLYGFSLGSYNPTRPLILDPAVIVYCGYIGGNGNGNEAGYGIAVDGAGNAYITGDTSSTEATFPVVGGPDRTFNGDYSDAFVAKVRADGAGLVYAGYIGGSRGDHGFGIAVDGAGNAYVTGGTSSTEATFPVVGGPDLTSNGSVDAFVAKVPADGAGLVYAGYIGGSDMDSGTGIAVGGAGNAYVMGWTSSTQATFPVVGGPDLTFNGSGVCGTPPNTYSCTDAFVAKVRADGAGLVYAGYIGGSGGDEGYGITVDGAGSAYVTGVTGSTEATFPVTVGPDLTYNGGSYDAFVAKVNAAGTGLVYVGYIGGSGTEYGEGIAVDGAGTAYVTGYTYSTEATFPVVGGPDLTYNGSDDAFVAKVNAAGTGLVYAGYIGGSGDDWGYGIAVDGAGNAYIAGTTDSTEATFPVVGGPDLTFNSGTYDAFVAKVRADGAGLVYAGYIGGSGEDRGGWGIAVDGAGNVYVTGKTNSTEATFPVVGGPDLTYNGGPYDAFVAKIVTGGEPLDLSVDSVTPVQVLEGQDLVRNKATAVKAVIRKTGTGTANNVSARLDLGSSYSTSRFFVAELGNMDAQNVLVADNSTYPLSFPWIDITKTIYFFGDALAPIGSTFQASVTVDPLDAISEITETNNMTASLPVQVHDVQWSDSNHPELYIHYFRTDWETAPMADFTAFYQSTNDFLKATYPVSDQRFAPNKSDYYMASTLPYRIFDPLHQRLSNSELSDWAFATYILMRLSHQTADRFVAVVPKGWFATMTISKTGALGTAGPNLRDFVIAEAMTPGRPNGPITVLHEIGHSYGLHVDCEEYDDCNPTRQDGIGNAASNGLWVEKRIPIQSTAARKIYCFMGGYADREYWIDADDYHTLLNSPGATAVQSAKAPSTTQAILAAGSVDISGTVSLDNWYILSDAVLSTLTPGPYMFEYQDGSGGVLYQQSFDISFALEGGGTLTEAPFVFTIPYVPGTAKIVVKHDGVPVAQKVVSPHMPTVTILSPNGGEQFFGQATINWSGSDEDGDTLSYTVLYSRNSGGTWDPVTGNLTSTNLTWDMSQLPAGSQYRVKVIATDGINTGEDVSNASFTILGQLYLPLVLRNVP